MRNREVDKKKRKIIKAKYIVRKNKHNTMIVCIKRCANAFFFLFRMNKTCVHRYRLYYLSLQFFFFFFFFYIETDVQ